MATLIQRSFAGGVIGPALHGRADQAKYQTGLRDALNWIVQRYGGVTNRPGLGYVDTVKDSTKTTALAKFSFNGESYILELGDQYVRFFKENAALDVGTPAAYAGGTTYSWGQLVTYAANVYVSIQNSNVGNQPDISPTWWYPVPSSTYEIPSPWAHTDVFDLNYRQSGDIITFCDHGYAPYELKRFGDLQWELSPVVWGPLIAQPTNGASSGGPAGTDVHRYIVTAIDQETGEESLAAWEGTGATITSLTNANPVVVTATAHGFSDGDEVFITGVATMTEVNDRTFVIANTAPNTFELVNEDGTGYSAGTGGTAYRTHIVHTSATPTAASPIVLTWNAVAGANQYYIYKQLNGQFGLLGTATDVTFSDTGITPDTTLGAPVDRKPFYSAGNYPSVVAYHQQRRWFANTINAPQRIWGSQIGFFANLGITESGKDTDGIAFELSGDLSQIQNMLDLRKLFVFTEGGEWTIEGDGSTGSIVPDAINPVQQGYAGSTSAVRPIAINNNALFVQARKRIIRDLRFDLSADGYQGRDLTIFGYHLFTDPEATIKRLDFQQNPHSVTWVIMEDGSLNGLTYMAEHDVWGWHPHTTAATRDKFLDVVVVSEEQSWDQESFTVTEDFVYFLVERTINSSTVKYIERLPSRLLAEDRYRHMKFLDSHLTYDGTNLTTAGYDDTATATLTTAGGWTTTDTLTLTMSAATFSGTAADVGNGMYLTDPADASVRIFVEIIAHNSTTVCSVRADRTVPAGLQATATTVWTYAVDSVAGLTHLEGEEVGVFGDGFEVDAQTVASGAITLPRAYGIIHVGLAYNCDAETLEPEVGQGTIIDRKKLINRATMLLENTRGLEWGPDEDHLTTYKPRSSEDPLDPPFAKTGAQELVLRSTWNDNGRTFFRQSKPLPATILAIAPSGIIGD